MYTSFLSIHDFCLEQDTGSNNRSGTGAARSRIYGTMTGSPPTLKTVVRRAVALQVIHVYPIVFRKEFKVTYNDV